MLWVRGGATLRMEMSTHRKALFVALPLGLVFSSALVFHVATGCLGRHAGFLCGMSFYWVGWCIGVPTLVRRRSAFGLLASKRPLLVAGNWWLVLLYASTLIAPLFIYDTVHGLGLRPALLIALAVPLAIINGVCEELFWRGLFVETFPESVMWSVVVPAILFALWHFAPQLAMPQASPVRFVLSTLPLGLVYGVVAFRTRSAKWCAVGHSISGILAFGGSTAVSAYHLMVG